MRCGVLSHLCLVVLVSYLLNPHTVTQKSQLCECMRSVNQIFVKGIWPRQIKFIPTQSLKMLRKSTRKRSAPLCIASVIIFVIIEDIFSENKRCTIKLSPSSPTDHSSRRMKLFERVQATMPFFSRRRALLLENVTNSSVRLLE